jgi:2'-5' RNA ligase
MYSVGRDWKNWMMDFRFGTLVFLPSGELLDVGNELRRQYDPLSAKTSEAHVTLTQPFTNAPSEAQISKVAEIIAGHQEFQVQIGPAVSAPNQRLVWFDVAPKNLVLNLREALHGAGFFRTDLPLTKGFIPHQTVSELSREPDEAKLIIDRLNSKYPPWKVPFSSIAWIIPDEDFVFKTYRIFPLGEN